jgi:hypothetical protein
MRCSCTAVATLVLVAAAATARAQDRDRCIATFEDAQVRRLHGELRVARAAFVACAVDACPALLRKDCAQAVVGLDAEMPTIVLGARDGAGHDVVPSAVYVDDEQVAAVDGRAIPADPGPHVVRFEHAPDAPVVEHVVLRVGDRNRAIIGLFPSPPPAPVRELPVVEERRPSRPMGWIAGLAAAGVTGVGLFTYFGLTGAALKNDLRSTCAPACSDDQVSGVRWRYIAADTSLAVGVVALAAAGVLYVSTSPEATAVRVTVGPALGGGAGLGLSRAF